MSTETVTRTEQDQGTKDARVRHYVERLTPKGVKPPLYSKLALCGEEVKEVVLDHSGAVCQACIDESQRRPVER